MNGFVIFFIVVFVVIPVIKNIVGAKPTSKPSKGRRVAKSGSAPNQATQNWAEVQKLLKQKINAGIEKPAFGQNNNQRSQTRDTRRDQHGHSDARKQTHQRMHAKDGNKNVFTESHQARVNKRDQRDRSERNRIEAMLHSKTNRSIVRDGNNSIDGWGKRGDRSTSNGFLFLILFSLIALLVLSKVAPELWVDILAKFRIVG